MKKLSIILMIFLLAGCASKPVVTPTPEATINPTAETKPAVQVTPTTDITTSASPEMNIYTQDGKMDFPVTQEEAIKIATDYENGIKITEIDLDEEHGLIVYEMTGYIGNLEYDIKIDANTGEIVEWRQD